MDNGYLLINAYIYDTYTYFIKSLLELSALTIV